MCLPFLFSPIDIFQVAFLVEFGCTSKISNVPKLRGAYVRTQKRRSLDNDPGNVNLPL
jgi:hypothetical protein